MSTEAPERIWLQLGNEETTYAEVTKTDWEITWCQDQIDKWDVEYIRADLIDEQSAWRIIERSDQKARIAELEAENEQLKKDNAYLAQLDEVYDKARLLAELDALRGTDL